MKTGKTVAIVLRQEQVDKIKKQAKKEDKSFSKTIREILDRNKEMDIIVTLKLTKEEYAKLLELARRKEMGVKKLIQSLVDEGWIKNGGEKNEL